MHMLSIPWFSYPYEPTRRSPGARSNSPRHVKNEWKRSPGRVQFPLSEPIGYIQGDHLPCVASFCERMNDMETTLADTKLAWDCDGPADVGAIVPHGNKPSFGLSPERCNCSDESHARMICMERCMLAARCFLPSPGLAPNIIP